MSRFLSLLVPVCLLTVIGCNDISFCPTILNLQAADRFGLDRLKRLCELEMLSAISVDSAAHILFTADQHNAEVSGCVQCACACASPASGCWGNDVAAALSLGSRTDCEL